MSGFSATAPKLWIVQMMIGEPSVRASASCLEPTLSSPA